jgi:hypothetical protein
LQNANNNVSEAMLMLMSMRQSQCQWSDCQIDCLRSLKEHAEGCQQRQLRQKSELEQELKSMFALKDVKSMGYIEIRHLQNMHSFYTENPVYSTKSKPDKSRACPSSS